MPSRGLGLGTNLRSTDRYLVLIYLDGDVFDTNPWDHYVGQDFEDCVIVVNAW